MSTRWLAVWMMALVVAAPALADYAVNYENAKVGRWACRLCPFDESASQHGAWSIGSIDSARGAARFGRNSGIDDDATYLHLDARYRRRGKDGVALEVDGRNLGLISRSADARAVKAGSYEAGVSIRDLPHTVAFDVVSPFRFLDGELRLPADWSRTPQTSGFGGLGQEDVAGEYTNLRTKRRRHAAYARWQLLPRLHLKTSYSSERKTGVVETYRDGFYQATALPQRLDHRTTAAEAAIRYEGEAAVHGVSFRVGRFANDIDALVWDDPYFSHVQQRRSSVAPDNAVKSLSVVSRWRLGKRTVVNATFGGGETRQDAPFLPYTTNPSIDVEEVAGQSLGGLRTSRHEALNITHRFTSRLRLAVSYTATEREDKREEMAFTPVLGDLFALPPLLGKAYSFNQQRTTLRLRYRAPGRFRLAAGGGLRRHERNGLEIAVNREQRGWFEAQRDIGPWQLGLRHARASRDASPFQANTANNPLSRRYYQAARDESRWQATVRFAPPTSRLSAGLESSHHLYDYPETAIGLRRHRSRRGHFDVAYRTTPFAATVFYDVEQALADTVGSSIGAEPDWHYDSDDAVTTAGTGIAWRNMAHRRIELAFDYAYANGIGSYATMFAGEYSAFSPLVSRHESLNAALKVGVRDGMVLSARVYVERYRSTDWALSGVAPQTIGNVLSFGRHSDNHHNRLVVLALERHL